MKAVEIARRASARRRTALAAGVAVSFAVALGGEVRAGGGCGGADVDGDGIVGGSDLAVVLGSWGLEGIADVDGSGSVDGGDLAIVLGAWGEASTQPGTFPAEWISGGPACPTEPPIQVHWFNDDLCILRQSLCTNFEAPFMYLIFGDERVLMQDTGAGGIQIRAKAFEMIEQWAAARGRTTMPPLVVSHSHGHGDHAAGDAQFAGQPAVTVVGTSPAAVQAFFGITSWPTQIVEYDLGNRIIDVIPIPGHQAAHIALYDRRTGILFTGDTLYPGRLYISAWNDYRNSIRRLVDFTTDKPLCHVLGTHIEMSTTPGVDIPIGTTYHPNEHVLQLGREHLIELNEACIAMGAVPHLEVHDDFIVHPLTSAGPGEGAARPAVNVAAGSSGRADSIANAP